MLTEILWWTGNASMALVLARAIKGKFFTKYLIFYIYLSHVLVLALVRFYFFVFKSTTYRTLYWYTEFFSLAIGYCVIWEIYNQALAAYPGSLQIARGLVLATFIVVVAKVFINRLTGTLWELEATVLDLERNLRTVQATLLVVVVVVLRYYMIPIGRNLRGIILGYGVFVSTLVINNTLWSQFGDRFQLWLQYSQSVAYQIALLIWCLTLWFYHPNPVPEANIEIERDYEWLSVRTAQAVSRARAQVLRGVRG